MSVTDLPNAADMRRLAEWQALVNGFGREDDGAFRRKVQPILRRLKNLPQTQDVWVIENGGNSAHACVFIQGKNHDNTPGNESGQNCLGLYLCLSLLTPIAALARGSAHVAQHSRSYSMPEPEELITPELTRNDWEQAVMASVKHGGFELLTAQQALTPLPAGVASCGYCLTNEPWDRLFHVLFSLFD